MRSPSRASTAPASTTTGPSAPIPVRTCWTPATPPHGEPAVPGVLSCGHRGGGRPRRPAAPVRRQRAATSTAWAPRRPLPAIISIFLGDQLEAIGAIASSPTRLHQAEWTSGALSVHCPSSARTPPTATAPLRSPSPATSLSSACPAPPNPSDANTILNTAVAKSLKEFVAETSGAADFECAAAAWVKS